jgi:CheY-like chemotaxis protein
VAQNAVGYTPEGGRIDVEFRLVRDGQWVELCVVDNGVGVPPEHLPKLMTRYYRVGEQVKGTGIGLALCRELLELHGGEIEIASPPPGRSQGTAVTVRLPLVAPPKVLAVDDCRTILMLLRRQLGAEGYEVITCGDGEEGLKLVKSCKPDLLITDSVLPEVEGVEMISRVKADHELRHMPILLITGAEVDRSRRELLEEFRIPALGKPWRQEELLTCVEDALFGKDYLAR